MPYLLDEGGVALLDEFGVETLLSEGGTAGPSTGGIGRHAIGTHAIAGDAFLPTPAIAAPEPPAFPRHLYTIDLCRNWARIAEAPAAVFDGVIRNLALGEWRLTGAVAALAFQGAYTLTDVDTIRLVRDADIVYAGYVAPVASGVGGLNIVSTGDGDEFTLTGADAWSVLASRVAYPTPTTEPPWADSWDIRTGVASTCAAGYITANTGGATTADRQIPGLTVVDSNVGLSGSWSARLQPLDQLVARVCRDGHITCRMTVDYAGAVTVTLRSPNDRRATVVVSDQGDLTRIEHNIVPPSSTYVIAGGQGNLNARTFATAGSATGTARREVFADQSSLSTLTEVQQAATTTEAAAQATLTVRAQITDTAAAGLRYLADYDIGDTIAIEIGYVRYPVVIESITFHVSTERSVVRPVLGDAAPDLVTGLLRDVAGLQSRFDTQIS